VTVGTVAPSLGHTLDISATRPVSFWRLVRVELRKSYDTRAGMWLLLTIVLLTLAVEGIVLAVTTVQDEAMNFCRSSASCW
jgi:ABC-2 type transport system permease protein